MSDQNSSIIEEHNLLNGSFSGRITISTRVHSGGRTLSNIFSRIGGGQNMPTPFTDHSIGKMDNNNNTVKINAVNYSFLLGQKYVDYEIIIKEDGRQIKTFHNKIDLGAQTSVVVINTNLKWAPPLK